MPKTKGKSCPKEQRDFWTQKDGFYSTSVVLVLLCHRPISRQKKERREAKFKKFKKNQTPLKRDTPHQNLSLLNDSNTRARIKQQQEQQRRGRSFERAKASENNYSGFLSKRRRRREDGFVVYFFVRFYDENHVDARKSPKSSREI